MTYPVDYSQHSGPTGRYQVKEMLHFQDGTVAEHCTKETTQLLSKFHDMPPVSNFGMYVVPATAYYLTSWQDINPSIRNVTFVYTKLS